MLFYLFSSLFLLRSNVLFLSSILVLEFKYFQIPNLLKITFTVCYFNIGTASITDSIAGL